MRTFEQNLELYAEVAIKVGLNLQPGQRLLIGAFLFGHGGAPIELSPLVHLLTAKAYQAGARYVDVQWSDEALERIRFQHAPRDSFDEFSTWRTATTREYGERGDAILSISADTPDLLADQDPQLVSQVQRMRFQQAGPVLKLIERNAMNWLVIAAPTRGWAAKVLPDVPAAQREARLWDLVFEMCRIHQEDPLVGWQAHLQNLIGRSDYLNRKQYRALRLRAPGTDLTIGLPAWHLWRSARMKSERGIAFTPNIPTEEVFTLPHKDQTEGTVRATRPLSVGGALVENFSLTFAGGRVVRAQAERGEEALHGFLATDEGACRIGEIALVPHRSPISQSGTVFYNILYDENASDHIALGNAYRFSLAGGETMSNETFAAVGGNQSLIHIDFMVGSGEMDVDGVGADGRTEPVMRGGEWAFEV